MAALSRFKHPEIPVAAVATGFPSGQYSLTTRLDEIKMAIASGAKEIDIVINRKYALNQQWEEMYEEVIIIIHFAKKNKSFYVEDG